MRLALLANPDSGSGDAGRVEAELRSLGAEVSRHDVAGHDEALRSAPDRIAVAGGDGSIGPAALAAARAAVELAVIPTGTANDLARLLEIPSDPEEACRLAAHGKRVRELDVGLMDGRPFLNVASLGLAPAAAEHASGLKKGLGSLAYLIGAVRAGAGAAPVRCRLVCGNDGDELFSGRAWQVTIACSGVFGAGSSVGAEPGDERLDAVAIEASSRLRLVKHAYGLRRGTIGEQPGVRRRRCRRARVELETETPFNVDGEVVRASGAVEFALAPERVRVVVG